MQFQFRKQQSFILTLYFHRIFRNCTRSFVSITSYAHSVCTHTLFNWCVFWAQTHAYCVRRLHIYFIRELCKYSRIGSHLCISLQMILNVSVRWLSLLSLSSFHFRYKPKINEKSEQFLQKRINGSLFIKASKIGARETGDRIERVM